ncbi:interferon alpha/beta receptor 2-like isoform X2 [Nelusetta ayraudi]|uniref:interferon alpha/beta receptor 2-like isoform X2 n=1 Tax=Nelusetta ayraudi TaxID=303726 RepID=UPI003F6F3656
MAALIWTLAWLPHVLTAVNELPPVVNLTLNSVRFNHTLTWEPGPGTPDGVRYAVSVHTESGTSWLPVVGCERVQRPLLACDLTLALPDPHQTYLANVTALLEGWTPGSALLEGIEPIRETKLDPPRLVVTPCDKGALCVEVLPPVENLRTIYQELNFQLEIKTAGTLHKMVRCPSRERVLENPVAGRQYCISICFLDRVGSGCSPPVCASTGSTFDSDALISILLCLLVLAVVALVALHFYTSALYSVPLPSILTSLTHMDVTLLLHSPSETSLFSIWATAPPSGTLPSLLDCSDEESVTESHGEGAGRGRGGGGGGGEGNYKGWLGTNLPSIQLSPQPAAGATVSTESSAADTEGGVVKEEEVAEEVDSRDMYLLNLTLGACRRQEKEQQQQQEEKEEPPSTPLEVNLLTLTFGTQGKPNEEEEEEEESPPLSHLTGGAEGAEQQTEEGGEEEEEEEQPDYISRSYFSRQN